MYAVGDAEWHIHPVGDGGGEQDLSYVYSGGRFPGFNIIPLSYCEHTICIYK